MNNTTQKLSMKEKLGYGFGDLASVLYWQTFMLYFTYFYTDVFLLPAGIAATMFLVSRLWDGVNDPIMGMIADRTKTRWGKFRPYLLWLCVPFAIAGVLVFTTPGFGMTGKIIWAYATFILIMMLYTAINIPYTSLLGVISSDSKERTKASSVKFMFAFAAGIIISASLLPMAKWLGRGDTSIVDAKIIDNKLIVHEKDQGSAQIVVYAEDKNKNKEKIEFAFTIYSADDKLPAVNEDVAVKELNLTEEQNDTVINIDGYFINPFRNKFRYEVESQDNNIAEAEIEGTQLTIKKKTVGNVDIKITAKDPRWGETDHLLRVNISRPENHSPELADKLFQQQTDPEKGPGSTDFLIDGTDTIRIFEQLSLKEDFNIYEVLPADYFEEISDTGIVYTAALLDSNESVFSVEASGASVFLKEIATGEAGLKITTSGENPEIRYVNVAVKKDQREYKKDNTKQVIDLNELFRDMDEGDKLSFSAESDNKKVIAPSVSGSQLSFRTSKLGMAKLAITASDNHGGQIEHELVVIVCDDRNNPPFIANKIDNVKKNAGFRTYEVDLSDKFMDKDGDPLSYSISIINPAKGWQRAWIIFGIAAIVFFLIAFRSTKERVTPPKQQKSSVKKDLKELVTNRPWLILLATTITFILFVAVRGSVTVHYFKYIIGTQDRSLPFIGLQSYDFETLASAYNTIGQISSFLGVLLIAWFAKIIGKKKAFVITFIVAIFSTGIVYFLTAEQLGLIFFFQITGSMTGGPLSFLIWAMYADTADYGEWKNGRRSTGLIFSASTMSQKFGWAIGAFIALNLMSQLGFQPNAEQSPESENGLLLLFTIIPAIMGIISTLILLAYPLNDKRVEEIEKELAERKRVSEK